MSVFNSCFFALLLVTQISVGQEYSLYSNDSLVITSKNLNETIRLNVHLPETFDFSSDTTKYPITIIFDSQHERTYPQIINSFDLLTSETQIPETIIIGIPFTKSNRYYFTSDQRKENDTLTGIERMERFLFLELIPTLKNEYKANDFISIFGHSRTAFLVNYLAFKKSEDINIAVALSGFFNDEPLSLESFQSFLLDSKNFPNTFSYYYAAGSTLEESSYLTQDKALNDFLSQKTLPANLTVRFEELANANHISNYWISVPPTLIQAFAEYNAILDNWFYSTLKQEDVENPVALFQADLANAGKKIGCPLNPNLTQIFSLASHFAYEKEDYKTASNFLRLGLRYFPEYLDFYVDLIEFSRVLDDSEKVESYKSLLKEKVVASNRLNESEKSEFLEYLGE